MKSQLILSFIALTFFSGPGLAAVDPGFYTLPRNCSELLPDNEPFVRFLEAVARGSVVKEKKFSDRIFGVLALRNELSDKNKWTRDRNPVDWLIRKTLCYYREQKEPLKPIPYDNPSLIKFLKTSLPDLEGKVEDAVFQMEFEREQRERYERALEANEDRVRRAKREATKGAAKKYNKISSRAKKKAQAQ